MAPRLSAAPFGHPLIGIEDRPRRAVAVDVDVHVEAGRLDSVDLRLDVFRWKGHGAHIIWGMAAARREKKRTAAHEGAVGP